MVDMSLLKVGLSSKLLFSQLLVYLGFTIKVRIVSIVI